MDARLWDHLSKIFRFVLIGMITSGFDVGVFYVTMKMTASLFVSTTLSFIVAVGVNYCGHSIFTFGSSMGTGTLCRYVVVLMFQYCLSLLLITMFSWVLGNALMAKLISIAVIVPLSFLLSNNYIFSRGSRSRPGQDS